MSWITIVPVAPLRAEPSHRSEMVSQLLFGERCDLLETGNDFLRVKCHYDGYEGWCQGSQLAYAKESMPVSTAYIAGFTDEVLVNGESCIVPHAAHVEPGLVKAGGYEILSLAENVQRPFEKDNNKPVLLKAFAYRYLNAPYLWGGKSVFGTDCSGFVQQVFKMVGIWLPRDSGDQSLPGESVEHLSEARLGDLAFFENAGGKVIHVGMMLDDNTIIHSSGNVHVDKIDNQGIIHSITGERTHRLAIIRRYF